MITFKQFTAEANNKSIFTPPTKLSSEEFIGWCEKNAKTYLNNASKYPIFRGMRSLSSSTTIIDTNGFNRVSANTENYYTWWLDNNPTWKGYPKRSKSLICSTDRNYAAYFGYLYLIIPSDKANIGICSKFDLWESFNYIKRNLILI